MKCWERCGACCIYISISSPLPGMPDGKPAGVSCIHLTEDYKCAIYDSPERPRVCNSFAAEPLFCGNNASEARSILSSLEGK